MEKKCAKIGRGLDSDTLEKFKKSELLSLYKKHPDELFLGIRNNYINLYYRCANVAEWRYAKNGMDCKIDKSYLKSLDCLEKSSGYVKKTCTEIVTSYAVLIKKNIDDVHEKSVEKKAQQQLVLQNNSNPNSNWYCVDLEYVPKLPKETESEDNQPDKVRFDIVAISKKPPHRVALIELKVGTNAMATGVTIKPEELEKIRTFEYTKTLGSGVLGHCYDFTRYLQNEKALPQLKGEIVSILENYRDLGLEPPICPTIEDFAPKAEVYFITLSGNKTVEQVQKSMRKYLCNDKANPGRDPSQYNVEEILGFNPTVPNTVLNPIFKFAEGYGDNIEDVIDDKNYIGLDEA